MTHNTVNLEVENAGSQECYVHQINITSLDAAGKETYSPNSEVNVPEDQNLGVVPVAQDNRSVHYSWNTSNQLDVTDIADASKTANNTAVGEVRLRVTGGGT